MPEELKILDEKTDLPLLPLRGIVVFPTIIMNIDIGREISIAAVEEAMLHDHLIMLSAQKDPSIENPSPSQINKMGTVAQIRHVMKLPGGTMRIVVEGIQRASIESLNKKKAYFEASIIPYQPEIDLYDKQDDKVDAPVEEPDTPEKLNHEALMRAVVHQFEEWVKLRKKIPAEALISVVMVENSGHLCDMIASHVDLKAEDRQIILEILDPIKRLEKLYTILTRELQILNIEKKINNRVQKQIEKVQKDYYLREQMKAIRKELGEDTASESDNYRERLQDEDLPELVKKTIEKEINRLEKIPPASAETGVISTYIDWLFSLPWNKLDKERLDLARVEKTLNHDHCGLTKVKERILEYLAVRKLSHENKAPIICLVGPPGVGKTSLASSIAKATSRSFARASLGGIRDEAEIRGHRRTYVGALPGQIITALRRAKSRNPVFLLDEIDKMASDFRGDPTAAMLEVLDPEQNSTFTDHYIELPFDLSQVLWIVTANDLGAIPRPLRDRMEIVELPSYTAEEKFEIAKKHLIKKQLNYAGLTGVQLKFSSDALKKIIENYTRESGVRELERKISSICRKAAKQIVEEKQSSLKITAKNLADFLGRPLYTHTRAEDKPQIGVCTGMAWTSVGGDILPTEAIILKGKGHLILTGQLGKVMQESAQAGLSYIRSRYKELGLDPKFYEKNDIHIHLPEGAIPKDGPSAGITMATAMISALTGRKVRNDVAMTGEITLRGRVLPIGGLKEKTFAAYRENISTVILPKENERDLEDIDPKVKEHLIFIPVETMDEVLEHALVK